MENQLRTTQLTATKKSKEKEDNIIEWITVWRRNWHIYVDMVLGIKLRRFQMIMIYLMGVSDVFFAICSRGLSKSFIVGLGAICKMNLYPYSEIVITSSTLPQANKMVEDKIRDELIKKLSPYLLYMYDNEYLIITKSDDGYKITNTLNGSILRVLPCLDSSRGVRATLLIYEECRLLKKGIIDSVFEKMAHPRQAKYLEKPEYASNKRWLEECQSIYITSARFKFEWFWRTFKDCVTGYYTDKKTRYNIFAGDIFMAIANGLKTWGDYRKSKKMSGEMDFLMEDLNTMVGEAEDAFFTIQSFKDNQIIQKCFRPPTITQLYMGEDLGNPQKQEDEIRLIISDFAFANTTSREKNDNTIIVFMSLHWKGNRFERRLDYIEGFPASDSLGAADRIRGLIWDYDADYYILDLRNGGEVLFNYLTIPKENPERGVNWDCRGLGLADKYQVVPQGKIEDLRSRTVDKNYKPCIIPMIGTSELNSIMWVELKKQLSCNNIKFLVSMQDRQTILEDNGEYFNLTSDELANELVPYGQTDELIREAINLKAEFKNDKVKLVEPRSGTKDRAVVLSYGNYIASLIENEWNKQAQAEEFDINSIQLVW